MTKYLAAGLAAAILAAVSAGWWALNERDGRVIAESANTALEAQVALQVQANEDLRVSAANERAAYDAAAAAQAEARAVLRQQIVESRTIVEGAAALITDEQWLCASEPTPAFFVDSVRINAARRSQND